jgi:sigma-B regulation protein RsbU (phosphoserine phosphatase)
MRADDDIESLADVQRLLLPDAPSIRGLRYAVHYQPADVAAGDYYDLMPLTRLAGDGHTRESVPDVWGMVIGDVSGHGPAAAMEAVQFDAILRTYRGDEPPGGPAGALTYANRHFFSRRPRRHFMTVFAVLSRPDVRELDYVSAGHPPALLRRGGSLQRLGEDGDIPLGIEREHRFGNSTCRFEVGDLLIAYTDGLPEATDAAGAAFGFERIEAILREAPAEPQAIVDALRHALFAHQGHPIGTDDQTIVVLQQQD